MSVIVRRSQHLSDTVLNGDLSSKGPSGLEIFCKGAPESVQPICNPSSIPRDYHTLLKEYTHHGYRVLALASKRLTIDVKSAIKLPRKEIESGLTFVGFIIFENKLKSGTMKALSTLIQADLRTVMCTGTF